MIEGSNDDGDYLVQVSAQVMTRDDSSGGWVPIRGGGLSKVRLCKTSPIVDICSAGNNNNTTTCDGDGQQQQPLSPDTCRTKPEYVILGQRIADNTEILHCQLKKDIQYTKANPKWHHWQTDEKRFGLSFERSEDAKAFDLGIRSAVADLTEGLSDGITHVEGEEGLYPCMELPFIRDNSYSRSASTTSTTTSSPGTNSPQSPLNNNNNNNDDDDPFAFSQSNANHLHRIHYSPTQRGPYRNVHHPNGGGNVSSRHHQQQQQQHFSSHLQQQHQLQQQQQQQQQQLLLQQQHQLQSSPLSDKHSGHKSSFDSSSGPEEIWVRPPISGKSDQALLEGNCIGEDGHHHHPHLHQQQQQQHPHHPHAQQQQQHHPHHRDLYKEESYVVFNKNKAAAPHEYSYPNLEPVQKPPAQRSCTRKQALGSGHAGSQQQTSTTSSSYPPLPSKNKTSSSSSSSSCKGNSRGLVLGSGDVVGSGRLSQGPASGAHCRLVSSQLRQCKHCLEVFSLDENPRGSCEDAPDTAERCIEYVSCVFCTSCLMYHCWADADGEFGHPCSCAPGDPNFCKRWTALSLLSMLIPCLWCYPPLKACHHCGTRCGLCGGRHKAA